MTHSPMKNARQCNDEETMFLATNSQGETDKCQYWIDQGMNVNTKNRYGQTALMLASHNGHFDVVRLLLDCGADEQLVDNWGYNALMKAASCGHSSTFTLLAKENRGILKNTLLGQVTILTESSLAGHMEIVKMSLNAYPELLDTPAELTNMTPLMLGVIGRHYNIVEFLLQNGASTTIRNSNGLTARNLCEQNEDVDILALFGSYSSPNYGVTQITVNVISAAEENEYDDMNCNKMQIKINVTPTSRLPTRKRERLTVDSNSRKLIRRSKSAESKTSRSNLNSTMHGIFEYILQSNGLIQFWPLFKAQEVDLKVFLSLQQQDFHSIGIHDEASISQLMSVVHHYKPLFNL